MTKQLLYWNNYPAIAEALAAQFPDEDLLEMDDARLQYLVSKLKNFRDDPGHPPEDILSAILTVWIQLQDGDGFFDDGRWDAWA